MLHTYKTEAIVIKRRNFSETDKIISLYTRRKGKKIVIAKGVRKIHSRKAAHLELFSYIKAALAHGKTWDYLNEVDTLRSFENIGKSIAKIAYGFQIIEAIDRLCPEEEPESKVFELLIKSLQEFDSSPVDACPELVRKFSISLLELLGYLPKNKRSSDFQVHDYLEEIIEGSLRSRGLLKKL